MTPLVFVVVVACVLGAEAVGYLIGKQVGWWDGYTHGWNETRAGKHGTVRAALTRGNTPGESENRRSQPREHNETRA
jgi:hypothetical protein